MLVPAIRYKEEILKRFAEELYTEKYFYYSGYGGCHELPRIDDTDSRFTWAIVDPGTEDILGYLSYYINLVTMCVESFGWYGFNSRRDRCSLGKRTALVIKDVYAKMLELFQNYHRVSWYVVGGNRVAHIYNKLMKEASNQGYQCYTSISHDCCKDDLGRYHNSIQYEVINPNK